MEIIVKRVSDRKILIKYKVDILSYDRTLKIKEGEKLKIGYEYNESVDRFTVYGLNRFNNPIRFLSQKYAIKMVDINFSWKQVDVDITDYGIYTLNIPLNIIFKLKKDVIRKEKIKRVIE